MQLLRPLAKVGPLLVMGKSFHAQPHDICADSRYSGLPFSTWFTRIRDVDGVPLPVNSIMASLCICVIIALLNLGCVLWRRCYGEPLPPARWSLGRWGIPCNIVALLYSIMSTLISFFPIFNGTGPADMNWSVFVRSAALADVKLTVTFSTGPAPSSLSSLS
jgi:hypothetical protein